MATASSPPAAKASESADLSPGDSMDAAECCGAAKDMIEDEGDSAFDVAASEFRFDQSTIAKFEASAEGRSLTRSFFLFALFYMWPYQTMSQMQNFLVEQFPEKRDSAGFVMMICCTWPMFFCHALFSCTGLSRRLSYSCKMVAPCALVVTLAVLLFLNISKKPPAEDQDFLLHALYFSALFTAIAESFTEPAVYGIAGLLPSTLTSQMVQAGNGACGFVVSIVQIGTRLAFNGLGPIDKGHLKMLTKGFILVMGLTSLCIIAIYMLRVRPTTYYEQFVDRKLRKAKKGFAVVSHVASDSTASTSACDGAQGADGCGDRKLMGSFFEAVSYVWKSFFAIMLTFFTTLTLWPVIPGRSCAVMPGEGNTLQSWWFDLILLTFNTADFIGKGHQRSLRWGADHLSPGVQLSLALVRAAIFAPLILASCAPQLYPTEVARWVILSATFLLGLSNGWLSTICFMRAPKALPPQTPNIVAEQASAVLVLGLFFGISSGCFVAYQLGVLVLSDALGVCYHSRQ